MNRPILKGYTNTGDDCFMDSVLMAMFGTGLSLRKQNEKFINDFAKGAKSTLSSFVPALIINPVNEGIAYCTSNQQEDDTLRAEIQNVLRLDFQQLYNGIRLKCSKLRQLVGKQCAPNNVDLSKGQQDPRALYERLLGIFDYYPMYGRTQTAYTNDLEQIEYVSEQEQAVGQIFHIADIAEITTSISESWNPTDFEELEDASLARPGGGPFDTYRFLKRSIIFDQIDVFVFNLKRETQTGVRTFVRNNEQVTEPIYKFDKKRITIPNDLQFNVRNNQNQRGEQNYRLLSAIVFTGTINGGGHYTTLLRIPGTPPKYDEWWLYDDLNRPQMLTDVDASKILETRCIMFFYFPMGDMSFKKRSPALITDRTSGGDSDYPDNYDDNKSQSKDSNFEYGDNGKDSYDLMDISSDDNQLSKELDILAQSGMSPEKQNEFTTVATQLLDQGFEMTEIIDILRRTQNDFSTAWDYLP